MTLTTATVRISRFRRSKIYAIIESGGKQYKVASGQVIDVDHLKATEGNTVELDRVLLIDTDGKVTIGTPTITGAKVVATVQGEVKGDKLIVFRYKPKVRYRRKTGHRQLYTRLAIEKIVEPGVVPGEPSKRVRRRKKEVTENGT